MAKIKKERAGGVTALTDGNTEGDLALVDIIFALGDLETETPGAIDWALAQQIRKAPQQY